MRDGYRNTAFRGYETTRRGTTPAPPNDPANNTTTPDNTGNNTTNPTPDTQPVVGSLI